MARTVELINKICKHIPKGYVISLHMENGAAWVTLVNANDDDITLPDSADMTIIEQLNDALCVANKWV